MADEGVERIEEMCEKNIGKHRLRPTIDGDGNTQHHRRNGVQFELLAEHSPQQKRPVFSKLILQPAHYLSGLAQESSRGKKPCGNEFDEPAEDHGCSSGSQKVEITKSCPKRPLEYKVAYPSPAIARCAAEPPDAPRSA
jgi:hypothetical protein